MISCGNSRHHHLLMNAVPCIPRGSRAQTSEAPVRERWLQLEGFEQELQLNYSSNKITCINTRPCILTTRP